MSTKRYLCSRHNESTPSAIAYGDHFWCFGCGARGPISELGLAPGESVRTEYVEDLQASLARIATLPKRSIRGFELPFNDRGYYLVYPCNTYYKFRDVGVDTAGGKYRGPAGHKKPHFVAKHMDGDRLILVEGEFNALTLAKYSNIRAAIISPGGAGDFYSKSRQDNLRAYARYPKIDIVVDNDQAGIKAAMLAKIELIVLGCPEVIIRPVEKDFNDTFTEEGQAGLDNQLKRLGL